ncbi:molybdopterin-dependent oxidoreductase [Acetobacterium paludosum]|uniref:Molybdopterin-dependent oxidoreductase n=1 Tax=Acetobacterium paludosum TaxID=52693 RepID=A0A923KRD3_9FIRM|nr:molybdopterin cofactor-binding domain-containing protein [Acetobacterium paludosum]MBC3887137.1 molybdopterin-dependent oxidoreductase [Acetobacterium paludosum]
MRSVNQPVRKKDAMSLVTGQPVYTQDIAPKDCLVVKILRSPYAHALIKEIKTESAMKLSGIECVLTYKDVPDKRFTLAGQTFPEPSPYDRLILDEKVRFIGDAVAIVAGDNEKTVDKALRRIKVKYDILEPILDFRCAKDNEVLIHPEQNWRSLCNVGADNKRNLCASGEEKHGDVDEIIGGCDWIIEQTYHTKANQQVTMETSRTFTYLDETGKLTCVTSTQIPFHVKRILSNALELPESRIRVIKPRIGGGFGAKQTAVTEVYPAIVTVKTGKPALIVYTRRESFIASSPRHENEIKVRIGADKNGIIKGIDMITLSNTGAYGEHGPTTVGLSGHKSLPLYGKVEAYHFRYDVVYTNVMSAGAYRGYGATQGIFALESAVNELAEKMGMDPVQIREINMVREGAVMPAYYGETLNSCALDRCMAKAKEMIGWDEKYPRINLKNGKVRSVGVSMAMQGSGIANVDTAGVLIKVNAAGLYDMKIGATDMGTGCDTILAQIAAECLHCSVDDITVSGVDTDVSPYDSGSYASSTTYVTGNAVVNTCETLVEKIRDKGARQLGCAIEDVEFDGARVYQVDAKESINLKDLTVAVGSDKELSATELFCSPVSPPPFVVGMAEVEIDKETGKIDLIDYVAVVDCGTVINTNLVRLQTEGGIAQGIGMALYEDITYGESGRNFSNSLMQYKIPTRLDVGRIRVGFESSYEPTGPFGAKSIGEVVINTPAPAIANAVFNGVRVKVRELPITAEKIYNGMKQKNI